MTRTQFRYLLVFYVLVTIAQLVSGLLPDGYPGLVGTTHSPSTNAFLKDHPWQVTFFLIAALSPAIAGLAGLYKIRHWGRALSLYLTIAVVLIMPFGEASQSRPIDAFFNEISTMLWGAILVIAYFGPISEQFAGSRSSAAEATADAV